MVNISADGLGGSNAAIEEEGLAAWSCPIPSDWGKDFTAGQEAISFTRLQNLCRLLLILFHRLCALFGDGELRSADRVI